MAAGSPPRPAALHPDLLLMDKPGRAVVRRTATALPGPRRVLLPRRAHHRTGRLDHDLERPPPGPSSGPRPPTRSSTASAATAHASPNRDTSRPLSDRKSTRLNSSHANISYA